MFRYPEAGTVNAPDKNLEAQLHVMDRKVRSDLLKASGTRGTNGAIVPPPGHALTYGTGLTPVSDALFAESSPLNGCCGAVCNPPPGNHGVGQPIYCKCEGEIEVRLPAGEVGTAVPGGIVSLHGVTPGLFTSALPAGPTTCGMILDASKYNNAVGGLVKIQGRFPVLGQGA